MSDDPVDLCLGGGLSPQVTLARLLLAQRPLHELLPRLDAAGPPAEALKRLITARERQLAELGAVLAKVDHDAASVETIRQQFDYVAARAPEAAVAAYSLNDSAILASATDELVAWLEAQLLLGGDVLDFGCGIGRVAQAIAPRVRSVLGVDISPAMLCEAERRNIAGNVRFKLTGGSDLGFLDAARLDLVLAVDSFPYLVQAGVAEAHARDFARVLRPGGALAIFNLSYRNDLPRDALDLGRWAGKHGLLMTVCGVSPFRVWDGVGFVLRKT